MTSQTLKEDNLIRVLKIIFNDVPCYYFYFILFHFLRSNQLWIKKPAAHRTFYDTNAKLEQYRQVSERIIWFRIHNIVMNWQNTGYNRNYLSVFNSYLDDWLENDRYLWQSSLRLQREVICVTAIKIDLRAIRAIDATIIRKSVWFVLNEYWGDFRNSPRLGIS